MKLLCRFIHHNDFHQFRVTELEALAELHGVPKETLWSADNRRPSVIDEDDMFCYLHLPNETIARAIAERSLLIKSLVHVWAEGKTYDEVLANFSPEVHSEARKYIQNASSFAFKVDAFGFRMSTQDQAERREKFSFLFDGNEIVDLSNPALMILIDEKWSHTQTRTDPESIYIGRLVFGRSKRLCNFEKYNLSKRPVLGPTTLDNELSFIMCNHGHVGSGKVVLDPFVGTGGILIAASHLGAMCVGSDIDSRVLKGWGVSHLNTNVKHHSKGNYDIFRNFTEYSLCRPDIVRLDNSARVWRRGLPWVDCIVTDPPYGIRAGARQTGSRKHQPNCEKTMAERLTYIPPTIPYSADQVIADLLTLAVTTLREDGLLVFLHPIEVAQNELPITLTKHPDLLLVSADMQRLTAGNGRLLVCMRKKTMGTNQKNNI